MRVELTNTDPQQVELTVSGDAITLKGEAKRDTEHRARAYTGASYGTIPSLGRCRSQPK